MSHDFDDGDGVGRVTHDESDMRVKRNRSRSLVCTMS